MKAGKFTIEEDEFEFSFSRSRGPGGQNVNKVNSKATLHWNIDSPVWDVDEDAKQRFVEKFKNKINGENQLVLTSEQTRNQKKNIDLVLEKLKEMLLTIEHPPKERKPIKISLTARQKRREERVIKHRKKQERLKNKCQKDYDE